MQVLPFESLPFELLWGVFVFLVVFNFLPACVAVVSRHPYRRDIAVLSVVSLFSFALWIALMVWAAGGARNDGVIGRFMGNRRTRRLVHLGVAGVAAFSVGSTLGGLNII